MTMPMERHVFDPPSLSRLQDVFHLCWQEIRMDVLPLMSAEALSSLRLTIAARIFDQSRSR